MKRNRIAHYLYWRISRNETEVSFHKYNPSAQFAKTWAAKIKCFKVVSAVKLSSFYRFKLMKLHQLHLCLDAQIPKQMDFQNH